MPVTVSDCAAPDPDFELPLGVQNCAVTVSDGDEYSFWTSIIQGGTDTGDASSGQAGESPALTADSSFRGSHCNNTGMYTVIRKKCPRPVAGILLGVARTLFS